MNKIYNDLPKFNVLFDCGRISISFNEKTPESLVHEVDNILTETGFFDKLVGMQLSKRMLDLIEAKINEVLYSLVCSGSLERSMTYPGLWVFLDDKESCFRCGHKFLWNHSENNYGAMACNLCQCDCGVKIS